MAVDESTTIKTPTAKELNILGLGRKSKYKES